MDYPIPSGLHEIPSQLLDLRSDEEIDHDLQNPKPVTDEKNIWFFWHQGYTHMHAYTKRNIRAWHRRFSKHGWVVRVVDLAPSSRLNVANFLDMHNPKTFPKAFVEGRMQGTYALQHTSDLVRWPLLLEHGGVYADVGLMQIGDLNRLWEQTLGDPSSPYEVLSYNGGPADTYALMNYFLCSRRNNPLFARCHRLLMELWNADGGKTSTEGMHSSHLLKGIPLMQATGQNTFEENGKKYTTDDVSRLLTDYIVQGQVATMVMSLIDEEDRWDGPQYSADHVYVVEFMVGSQLINEYTAWDGSRAFQLMSLSMPKEGEAESEDQKKAREIVEGCLQKSFGFKLAHGLILRVHGETLGSLWRKHTGSDDIPGTYAHWMRQAMIYCNQDGIPANQPYKVIEPLKRGPLLREA